MQDDVLVRVLGLLQPCQLHWTERVNKRFRNIGMLPAVKPVLCWI